jgi:nucleotide-binding universal stress UspA family protein
MTIGGIIGVQTNPHIHNVEQPEPLVETLVLDKPADFQPKRTIVVPVDNSAFSQYTIDWALENIIKPDDLVVLLNVRGLTMELQSFHTGAPDSSALDFLNHKSVSHSAELIQKYGKKLAAKGINAQGFSMAGDPRYTLVQKIHELKPQMVLIGQRGMGAFSRAILGSVSDYVLHHSHVPVTVVAQPKA